MASPSSHLTPKLGQGAGCFSEVSGRDGTLSLSKKKVSLGKGRPWQRVSGFVPTSGPFLLSGEETKDDPSLSLRALCKRL